MDNELVERLEVKLVVDTVKQLYGYDFSQYRASSIHRRLNDLLRVYQLKYISELLPLLLHKADFFEDFVANVSVSVTDFFRDPYVYKVLAKQIAKEFDTNSEIKVWSAGCATGEEPYSLAIIFKEAGIFRHFKILATDMCQKSLEIGRAGIYSHASIRQYNVNYQESGGKTSFSDFFTSRYDFIKMTNDIMKYVSFERHNLVIDVNFSDVQLIVCRNVLIYFSEDLQNQVLQLFVDSLGDKGLLVLGVQDCLFSPILEQGFDVIDKKGRIYRKKRVL